MVMVMAMLILLGFLVFWFSRFSGFSGSSWSEEIFGNGENKREREAGVGCRV